MENHDKKTITIKNALVSDKDFIETTRLQLGEKAPVSEALNKIIKCAIGYEGMKVILTETNEETGKLKAEILELTESVNTLTNQVHSLIEENYELSTQEPKTIEVTKEVEKTVDKPLTGSQFICELEEQTALNVRKVRSFAKKDGYVTGVTPNEFVNMATKYFLKRIYIDLID